MTAKQRRTANGRALFDLYCEREKLPAIERKQDYTVSDAITDLLHFANAKKYDVDLVTRRAVNNFEAERTGTCADEHCALRLLIKPYGYV